jgi:hypothetical protein
MRQRPLIERSNTSRVQLKMSRVRVILVLVMPALLLLVSTDCFGDPATGCGCGDLRCFFSAEGGGKQKSSSPDSSCTPTVQRWCRRVNVQPGSDVSGGPVALAQTPIQSEQAISTFVPPLTSLELIQAWQFLWRTALEPRAPSLVS